MVNSSLHSNILFTMFFCNLGLCELLSSCSMNATKLEFSFALSGLIESIPTVNRHSNSNLVLIVLLNICTSQLLR